MIYYIISWILEILIIVVPLLISVAYFTLAERKVIASIQRRRGPNVVGIWGLLQPLADGLKLLVKETIFPSNANVVIFILAPVLTFLLSLMGWAVIPFGHNMVLSDLNIGLLYIFAVSSLGVYGSSFFMATGFHGFHVLVGSIFLMVCLYRQINYHFSKQHHFGFEAAAWYWHFVDVVWLFLFTVVYWWGGN